MRADRDSEVVSTTARNRKLRAPKLFSAALVTEMRAESGHRIGYALAF
jgi:hypothetical protein